MNRAERMRRIAILCCHCLRNIAFYRAGWRQHDLRVKRQFWIGANANAIDVAVLDWCKLFWKGKHHWEKVVPEADQSDFLKGLCDSLNMSEEQFASESKTIAHYRDKFVGHLDDEDTMLIPTTRILRRSTAYLYEHIRSDPVGAACLADAPAAGRHYAVMYRHAYHEYATAARRA